MTIKFPCRWEYALGTLIGLIVLAVKVLVFP